MGDAQKELEVLVELLVNQFLSQLPILWENALENLPDSSHNLLDNLALHFIVCFG